MYQNSLPSLVKIKKPQSSIVNTKGKQYGKNLVINMKQKEKVEQTICLINKYQYFIKFIIFLLFPPLSCLFLYESKLLKETSNSRQQCCQYHYYVNKKNIYFLCYVQICLLFEICICSFATRGKIRKRNRRNKDSRYPKIKFHEGSNGKARGPYYKNKNSIESSNQNYETTTK